jgi:hypothetical protein
MNSSQLLQKQAANNYICSQTLMAVGPTGPMGPMTPGPQGSIGPTGPPGVSSQVNAFTIFLDYTTSSPTLSRVKIPPGLLTAYPDGGLFTADSPGIAFITKTDLTLTGTTYPFITGMNISGYIPSTTPGLGAWSPINGGNIGLQCTYSSASDYNIIIKNLSLTYINGGNSGTKPTTGIAAGFLVTVTLFYM